MEPNEAKKLTEKLSETVAAVKELGRDVAELQSVARKVSYNTSSMSTMESLYSKKEISSVYLWLLHPLAPPTQ